MPDTKDPRILFAAERTLLAWNRTSLALIAFGFVVERAGLLMSVLAPEHAHSLSMIFTFWIGLVFILVGAGSAAYAARQFARVIKSLGASDVPTGYGVRWGMFISATVAVLAIVLAAALFVERW